MRLLPRALRSALGLLAVPLCCALLGCMALQRASVSRTEYELYRRTRVAPTEEARLRAASQYLAAGYAGPFRSDIEAWFDKEVEARFKAAWDDKEALSACLSWLTEGPRAEEARARLAHLERVEHQDREDQTRSLAEAERMQAELERAQGERRRFLQEFSEWLERALALRAFGRSTQQLPREFIAAYQDTPPRATCEVSACRKSLEFSYLVPEGKALVVRNARLEVRLLLEQGEVRAIELSGPWLWTRLAEALLPAEGLEVGLGRVEALATVVKLVELKLDRQLPLDRCSVGAVSPELLVRRCDGTTLRLLAAEGEGEPDTLQISGEQGKAAQP
jgi:hypothetical protein